MPPPLDRLDGQKSDFRPFQIKKAALTEKFRFEAEYENILYVLLNCQSTCHFNNLKNRRRQA